ncbi:MAG: M15 family metallopeptidase [Alphaproteobacteria bacterium]|nr:M15 family metallopeptidase [Alphaproteobacteria bacterium]
MRGFGLAILLIVEFASAAAAEERSALDALVRAYPQQLAGYDAMDLIWRDGTRMPLSDRHPSILDQLRLSYTAGISPAALYPQNDAGRARNRPFFDKMYGNCWKGEVAPSLVPVVWLPQSWGRTVRVTSVNGIAQRLTDISDELEALPSSLRRYLYPSAGTYNCRVVADTGEPSMHSWGAAIDINSAYAEYWLWPRAASRGTIPPEIIEIFERHGFIWGGKWSHYDTMHFEYRPELLTRHTLSIEPDVLHTPAVENAVLH